MRPSAGRRASPAHRNRARGHRPRCRGSGLRPPFSNLERENPACRVADRVCFSMILRLPVQLVVQLHQVVADVLRCFPHRSSERAREVGSIYSSRNQPWSLVRQLRAKVHTSVRRAAPGPVRVFRVLISGGDTPARGELIADQAHRGVRIGVEAELKFANGVVLNWRRIDGGQQVRGDCMGSWRLHRSTGRRPGPSPTGSSRHPARRTSRSGSRCSTATGAGRRCGRRRRCARLSPHAPCSWDAYRPSRSNRCCCCRGTGRPRPLRHRSSRRIPAGSGSGPHHRRPRPGSPEASQLWRLVVAANVGDRHAAQGRDGTEAGGRRQQRTGPVDPIAGVTAGEEAHVECSPELSFSLSLKMFQIWIGRMDSHLLLAMDGVMVQL